MPRENRPDLAVFSRLVQTAATRDTTQNRRHLAGSLERATADDNVDARRNSGDHEVSRDGSDGQFPSTSSSLADMVTETVINTVYEEDDDKDDESVESNDDAVRRAIEHQPTKKFDIAVGTGTHVSKYEQYDAR